MYSVSEYYAALTIYFKENRFYRLDLDTTGKKVKSMARMPLPTIQANFSRCCVEVYAAKYSAHEESETEYQFISKAFVKIPLGVDICHGLGDFILKMNESTFASIFSRIGQDCFSCEWKCHDDFGAKHLLRRDVGESHGVYLPHRPPRIRVDDCGTFSSIELEDGRPYLMGDSTGEAVLVQGYELDKLFAGEDGINILFAKLTKDLLYFLFSILTRDDCINLAIACSVVRLAIRTQEKKIDLTKHDLICCVHWLGGK